MLTKETAALLHSALDKVGKQLQQVDIGNGIADSPVITLRLSHNPQRGETVWARARMKVTHDVTLDQETDATEKRERDFRASLVPVPVGAESTVRTNGHAVHDLGDR